MCKPSTIIFVALLATAAQAAAVEVQDLRCQYVKNPLGIDAAKPRLSWIVAAGRRGERQTAYRVLVASTPELLAKDSGDLWDSGKIESDRCIQIEYSGRPLQSRMFCHWKVRIWDKDGKASAWGGPAFWTMGLLKPEDWKAQWIGWQPPVPAQVPRPEGSASPWLRKTFDLAAAPTRALAYVNAAGYCELYVNGRKVGDDVLGPAVVNYQARSFYLTYDIAPYLQKGRNCLGVWLGRGWHVDARPAGPRIRLQCDMAAGGRTLAVVSDNTWKAAASPYTTMSKWGWNNFGGERYDARLENAGWCAASCDDRAWANAETVPSPSPRAEAQSCPPNRVGKSIPAAACTELSPGRYELDMGTNLSGWLRLTMPALKAGDRVVMDYADRRSADDARAAPEAKLNLPKADSYQTFNQRDEFISAGGARETFCSKFNYHGFRYVVIQGLPSKPDLADARALSIESDLEPRGSFECSNRLFNRLHQLDLWTIRSLDLGGYLVDCPHRERLGYGDGQVSAESCIMNLWMPAYYGKWLADWRLRQNPQTGDLPHVAPVGDGGGGPGWGGTLAALAWRTHLYYGDRRILEENYEPMRRYVDSIESRCQNDILRAFGGKWDFIGDWVPPGRGMDTKRWPPQPAAELFNNCYRIYLWELLAQSAAALGREDEVQRCRARLDELRPAIHRAFYDPQQKIYVLDEQTYQVMPLIGGVTPASEREAVFRKLEDGIRVRCNGHLDTGMLGTYFLIHYLQATGRNDLLFTIANQQTYPGWGYMLNQGATTLWEQWNGHWSRIHSCFTSLDGWFYQGLAGILPDPSGPGFKKIVIKPSPVGDLTWVKAHYDSPHGRIVSNWNRDGQRLTMDITIPANTTATVYVPASDAGQVTESGKPAAQAEGVAFQKMAGDAAEYHVVAGTYRFHSMTAWKPAAGPLMTRWAKDVSPDKVHPEYPRPQLVRADWLNLNGLWQLALGKADDALPAGKDLPMQILVPFPVESALSGVMQRADRLWYRRTFQVPEKWQGRRVLLHFQAVDWETAVYVNGKPLGEHRGGYDAFSFDITDALKPSGDQELIVKVFDPTNVGSQPRGKQVNKPGGIMYTSTTGIWQTVWLEPVPAARIGRLLLTPDLDGSCLKLTAEGVDAANCTVQAVARDGQTDVAQSTGGVGAEIQLAIPKDKLKTWSPNAPFLYDLAVTLKQGDRGVDQVQSYFGMRKIDLGKDEQGKLRMRLNNQFVFQIGPLDQGFWPDGLYAAPTDEALRYDIEVMKKLGFNMARKHVKIEPDRWYYWCDKLGLLVWQDMPSGDKFISPSQPDIQRTKESAEIFERELRAMIEQHYNHPSIVMWVVYNEGWGQWETPRIVQWVKKLDPSRLIDNASGWSDRKCGDVLDIHAYPGPDAPPPQSDRAGVLGEFGGLGLGVDGHTWTKKTWGYEGAASSADLTRRYEQLLQRVHGFRNSHALSAAVYTQITDVETECNGLMTYDRAVIKVDADKAAAANRGQ